MLRNEFLARVEWLVAVGVILGAGAMARADDVNVTVIAAGEADDLPARRLGRSDMTLLVGDAPSTQSERWIGLLCTPADAALRAQLKIAEGQGLLVREVVPDGPAAKAGLQRYDIVLAANGKPLNSVTALVAAVLTAGDDDLALKILRQGTAMTVRIHPAKRPADRSGLPVPAAKPYIEWLQPLMEDGGLRLSADGLRLQMRRIAPGALVWTTKPPLPDDVSIWIKKEGDKLAQIMVQQGEEKWKATEDQLDKLPAKVQEYVQSLTHGIADTGIHMAFTKAGERLLPKGPSGVHEGQRRRIEIRKRFRAAPEELEQRLKQLEQKMDKLLEPQEERPEQESEAEEQ